MATVASLNRRITELESQIAALNSKQEETKKRIKAECDQKINELKAQFQKESERNRHQLESDFDRRAQGIHEELLAQMQKQIDEIREVDARAQRERQQLMDELRQVNDELKDELDALKQQEQQRTETSRAMAEGLSEQAAQQRETVESLPHGFFCEGQLDVYAEHLSQVQTFLSQGMCEAAASTADICLAELKILEINVRSLQHDWEDLYWEYRGQASALHDIMEQFERDPVESPMGEFILEDEDRTYWSSGQYPPVHDEVEESYQLVSGIDAAGGVTEYLCGGVAPRGREMVQAITGLYRLSDRLSAATTCIKKEMGYSDERELLAKRAEELLSSQGFYRVSGGYRNDEPLDSYVLELTNNGLDILRLTFVPVREDGVTVRNICLVSFDVRTAPGGAFVQTLTNSVVEIMQNNIPHLQTLWDGKTASEMKDVEKSKKAVPDMRLLVQHLEKKYQS